MAISSTPNPSASRFLGIVVPSRSKAAPNNLKRPGDVPSRRPQQLRLERPASSDTVSLTIRRRDDAPALSLAEFHAHLQQQQHAASAHAQSFTKQPVRVKIGTDGHSVHAEIHPNEHIDKAQITGIVRALMNSAAAKQSTGASISNGNPRSPA